MLFPLIHAHYVRRIVKNCYNLCFVLVLRLDLVNYVLCVRLVIIGCSTCGQQSSDFNQAVVDKQGDCLLSWYFRS
jgi:hypothetical protein